MFKVKFYMRSGSIMEFECESIKTFKNGCGVLTGYEIDHGTSTIRVMDARVKEIEGITVQDI